MKTRKLLIPTIILALISCQMQTNTFSKSHSLFHSSFSAKKSIQENPWKTIKNSSQIRIPHNERIHTERKKLLSDKNAFQTATIKAEPFMYYIIDQLKIRNMPIELAIIPLMESAYNPMATSSAKAAGLWQMIPTTARAYGIKSTSLYDSRRDLVASTQAALNYLQYLNDLFHGDWLLTLAAYNAGEGRIRKAQQWNLAHHLPTHFWALKLPTETMNYVSKLLAIVDLVQHNNKYEINLPKGDYTNALVQINIGKPITLETVAKFTNLSLNELQTYNAAYITNTIKKPYHLYIPGYQVKKLHQNLITHNFTKIKIVNLLGSGPTKKSDTVSNMNITNDKYVTIKDADLQYYAKEHLRYETITYKIKPGDSLSYIAKIHKVPVKQLLQWNQLKDANSLRAGNKLVINNQH